MLKKIFYQIKIIIWSKIEGPVILGNILVWDIQKFRSSNTVKNLEFLESHLDMSDPGKYKNTG